MKTLENFLTRSLNEAAKVGIPLAGASGTRELIDLAANFDNFTNNAEDWGDWEDWFDFKWIKKNLSVVKAFCDICKKIDKSKIDVFCTELGNYSLDEFEEMCSMSSYEEECEALNAKGGDYVYCYCTDGDNGYFLIMVAHNNSERKLIEEFEKITFDPSGWDPQTRTIPKKNELNDW